MYVKINRNVCGHHLAACERCLGRFLTYPYGYERRCFEEVSEDETELLTLDITTGDRHLQLKLDEETRLLMAGEGWAKVLELTGLL